MIILCRKALKNRIERLVELGKYKDFNLSLMKAGYTSRGVKVAIIDQSLNISAYPEIVEKIKPENYFLIGAAKESNSSMHGVAVSSILCRKELGIAPDVELYYFSYELVPMSESKEGIPIYYINAFNKILELNKNLQKNRETLIKMVSISDGLIQSKYKKNWNKLREKIKEIDMVGISIIHTTLREWEELRDKIFFSGFRRDKDGNFGLCRQERDLDIMKIL